ncbi:MAG: M42 family peptidase, partial [Pseudooceanicola sp.]|nr:M42 family peptidase [Pseudooceanicola sp.]
SLYSFHGRGTLNGVIPHPSLVATMEAAAETAGVNLQRSAQVGVLTDLSYVQLVGAGVAAVDVGFPMRYSHSAVEMVDLSDLDGLAKLLVAALDSLAPDVPLERP